ncbi:hypothetical protein LAZ67_3000312 [Cordylochernes scorpioides]|uniref:Reverse transcriptase n=1 Tax=Cordylochernes scorpioides TaxID=51811 RepID=A0ABY6K6Y0_9ARAC|nr:hypothetical protein LAZ67_3000312 [Cordylochernes scorpioides]
MADSLARLAFKYPAPYVPIPTPKSWFKYSARKKAISDWQTSWDASLKGRSLYNWIKFVKADRIYSSSALNSILTGHGPFSNYFQRFKIKTPSPCRCGYANPDSDHFLLACPLLDSSRPRCLKKPNPNKPHLLSDHRKALTTFSEIANDGVKLGGWKRRTTEGMGAVIGTISSAVTKLVQQLLDGGQGNIEVFETYLYRRALKIPWTDMVTYNQVLDRMGTERQLINFIKQRKLTFAVMRGSAGETLLTVLEGKLRGKRSRGRR